jgi:hypothetical protein
MYLTKIISVHHFMESPLHMFSASPKLLFCYNGNRSFQLETASKCCRWRSLDMNRYEDMYIKKSARKAANKWKKGDPLGVLPPVSSQVSGVFCVYSNFPETLQFYWELTENKYKTLRQFSLNTISVRPYNFRANTNRRAFKASIVSILPLGHRIFFKDSHQGSR